MISSLFSLSSFGGCHSFNRSMLFKLWRFSIRFLTGVHLVMKCRRTLLFQIMIMIMIIITITIIIIIIITIICAFPKRCYSYVGKTGRKQQLSLARGCWRKATIIHEIGENLHFLLLTHIPELKACILYNVYQWSVGQGLNTNLRKGDFEAL